jgi:hypothetical protein
MGLGVTAAGRKPVVRFTAMVARAILWRVAMGEALSAICSEDGLPTHGTVGVWAKKRGAFGRALRTARQQAGWPCATSPGLRYDPVAAARIYARLCEGEALYRICEEPGMPSHSAVYRWRHAVPEFAAALREARWVQAERYAEMGWEIAEQVTPGNAYATSVKLTQLRWTAGVMDPARFGRFKPVTAEVELELVSDEPAEDEGAQEVEFYVRQFEKVTGPDGEAYVREVPRLEGPAAEG